MPKVVSVTFPHSTTELWFNPVDVSAHTGDCVICKTSLGLQAGTLVKETFEVDRETLLDVCGHDWLHTIERVATQEDLDKLAEQRERAAELMDTFRQEVSVKKLDMKPLATEFLFDEQAVICYYTSQERVDFRELVKSLAHKMAHKIEMRQIGPRQEAALKGGIAHCGCEFCCSKWERDFPPVSIKMAKDQDLSINSEGISGSCGRLMCCLRFETEAYRDFKKRAPKKGATIKTPAGPAKVVAFNTPKEQLDIKFEETGKRLTLDLCDLVASQDAHKKAEQNNCPLRPDTLPQEVFERLTTFAFDSAPIRDNIQPVRESSPNAHEQQEKPHSKQKRSSDKKHRGMQPRKRKRRTSRETQPEASAAAPQQVTPHKRIRKHRAKAPGNNAGSGSLQGKTGGAPDVRPGRHQRSN